MIDSQGREGSRGDLREPDWNALVDAEAGWIDRRIFFDEAIYRLELERIFARCWIFIAHDSQLPEIGDFLTTSVGEDAVIVARASDGAIHCFLNSCSHRGNRVCFAETGRTRRFACNFHGWQYGLDGRLVGVPRADTYRGNPTFDRRKLGLHAGRVEAYHGMNFVCFDPEAPSLEEYLGDFRWYLDAILDNEEGGIEFLPGCIKSRIRCNWKLPAENFVGDAYHATWTHACALNALFGRAPSIDQARSYHVTANGHGWEFGQPLVNAMTLGEPEIIDYLRAAEARMTARIGAARAKMVAALGSGNVFPNLSFLAGHNTFRTWNPKGPCETELHTWVFLNKSAPESLREKYRRGVMLTFSPSGLFEMDDGENFEHSTLINAGVVTRRQKLHLGLGHDSQIDHPDLRGTVHQGQINEANQRAFYQRWVDLMRAAHWRDVTNERAR